MVDGIISGLKECFLILREFKEEEEENEEGKENNIYTDKDEDGEHDE